MAPFVICALAALLLSALLRPFFRQGVPGPASVSPGGIQQLLDNRETLMQAMRELEYDLKLGNMTREEYERLNADYEEDVIAVMRSLDEKAGGLEAELEREVESFKRAGRSDTPDVMISPGVVR